MWRLETAGCRQITRAWSIEATIAAIPIRQLWAPAGELWAAVSSVLRSGFQLLAYLPGPEGLPLGEGAVNLHLELYRIASSEKVRIRLGIPVLPSMAF